MFIYRPSTFPTSRFSQCHVHSGQRPFKSSKTDLQTLNIHSNLTSYFPPLDYILPKHHKNDLPVPLNPPCSNPPGFWLRCLLPPRLHSIDILLSGSSNVKPACTFPLPSSLPIFNPPSLPIQLTDSTRPRSERLVSATSPSALS